MIGKQGGTNIEAFLYDPFGREADQRVMNSVIEPLEKWMENRAREMGGTKSRSQANSGEIPIRRPQLWGMGYTRSGEMEGVEGRGNGTKLPTVPKKGPCGRCDRTGKNETNDTKNKGVTPTEGGRSHSDIQAECRDDGRRQSRNNGRPGRTGLPE